MLPSNRVSRRRFLALTATTSTGVLAGCSSDDGAPSNGPEPTATPELSPRLTAIKQVATPFELSNDDERLDAVAADLAMAPIIGIGETSHGVKEFKTVPYQLLRRLVADHGCRLLTMEGTLGDFEAVNGYVTGEHADLETAMSGIDFYFWRDEGLGQLFEWLREFNEGRPDSDQAVVYGYDAQFYDTNATAIRTYLRDVDPDYLDEIDDQLEPLTTPPSEDADAEFMTDTQTALIKDLREQLRSRKATYVEQRSESSWQLTRRHVWTLEAGLRFFAASHRKGTEHAEAIRDEAMAENVAWLRKWTDAPRTAVLGNANHTMRGYRGSGESNARMGQHLTDEFGDDYYSLGQLFGTGTFAAPTNHDRTEFDTFELGGPIDGTLADTLTSVPYSRLFLDFETARQQATLEGWLEEVEKIQFSVPKAPERGALPLPAEPGDIYDGVVFIRNVSPAFAE